MIRFNTLGLAAALATTALTTTIAQAQAQAQDWRAQHPVFRVGLLGGENESDRLRNNECLRVALEARLGIPVEMFPAPDYAGVIQGLLAGQLDSAALGASAYAAIHLQDPNAVDPVFVSAEADGSLGYVAVMYVRADSAINSIEDMRGRSLAYADPNSTSGFLVPQFELRQAGINDAEYFSSTGFGGGHEQAVIAVLQGQYDAGVTWVSGQGDPAQGYSRGNLRRMIDNGLLNMADLRIIWTTNLIPNGPVVIHNQVPSEAREIFLDYHRTQLAEDPDCYRSVSFGEGQGWVEVDHDFFAGIVEMRRQAIAGSR
jgi:phosphonate transport system substrate-binding protein